METISVYQRTLEDIVFYLDNANRLQIGMLIILVVLCFVTLSIAISVFWLKSDLVKIEIQKAQDRHDYINRLTSILARDELELMRLAKKIENGNGNGEKWK